jgi:hypothetical protein
MSSLSFFLSFGHEQERKDSNPKNIYCLCCFGANSVKVNNKVTKLCFIEPSIPIVK